MPRLKVKVTIAQEESIPKLYYSIDCIWFPISVLQKHCL